MAYLQITRISAKRTEQPLQRYIKNTKHHSSQRSTALFQKSCWYVPKMCRFCIVSTRLNRLRRISDLSYLPQMWLRRSNPI